MAGDRTHAGHGRQHPRCRTVPGVWALGLWRGCRPLPCPKEVVPGDDDHLQIGRGRRPSTAAPLGAELCPRPRGWRGWTVDIPPVETPEGSGPPPLLTASPGLQSPSTSPPRRRSRLESRACQCPASSHVGRGAAGEAAQEAGGLDPAQVPTLLLSRTAGQAAPAVRPRSPPRPTPHPSVAAAHGHRGSRPGSSGEREAGVSREALEPPSSPACHPFWENPPGGGLCSLGLHVGEQRLRRQRLGAPVPAPPLPPGAHPSSLRITVRVRGLPSCLSLPLPRQPAGRGRERPPPQWGPFLPPTPRHRESL